MLMTMTRDIMKLTALFTAKRGRSFLAALSAREGRNYQFDFLRPTHSLFGYFNRLVEQYTKVLHPSKELLEGLKERTKPGSKWKTLELSRKFAKWEQIKREKEKKRLDDQEAERSKCFHPFFSFILIYTTFQLLSLRLSGTTTPLSKPSSLRLQMPTLNFRRL
jgi:hypothetical protein